MRVTIITAVFNGVDFIEDCILSVLTQNYRDLEYILIDGGSTDGTLAVVHKYLDCIGYFETGPDMGMYDALNKGIQRATGDVVGILNSDDLLADIDVVSSIAHCFRRNSCDAVYGNLNVVMRGNVDWLLRSWKSRVFNRGDLEFGWMPAHPTLYLKKELFMHFGNYTLDLGCSADYEMVLRLFYTQHITAFFLNKLLVIMRSGGMGSRSFRIRALSLLTDYGALTIHNVRCPAKALFGKKIRKLKQFIR